MARERVGIAKRNVRLFYFLTVVSSSAFISGNWIFYWLRAMSYGTLGIVDASAFAFGLVMEVPTGAISDLIGKKWTLMVATLLNVAGWTGMGLSDSVLALTGWFFVTQVGWAFYSGAAEAMVYDSLKEEGQEVRFEKVIATTYALSIVMVVAATLVGGLLYVVHFRLPHLAWGGMYALGFVATLFVREPAVEREPFSVRGYFGQLGEGFRQLGQPSLRRFTPLILATLGVYFVFGYGLVQPALAVSFGFGANEQAVVYAVLGLLAAAGVRSVPWLRRRLSDAQGLTLLGLLLALGFLSAALPLGYVGFVSLLLIRLGGGIANPWVSVVVNREVPSQARATTLSTVALLTKIPYAATAVLAGMMVERGYLWLFSAAVGGLVLALLAASVISGRRWA
ncbi:MAG TPA: MFS transporter, partial [Ardenticatenaceae bacterium]